MNQNDLTDLLELGLIGIALLIITAPIWLTVAAWRALHRNDY